MYIFTYRYPNWENKINIRPIRPTTQTPRIRFQLGWTITKLIHVQIYFQAHPVKALQLTSIYQCCIQAQPWPNMHYKCLWYLIHLITVQKKHHHFPFSTSASPTQILLANRHVDHLSCSYLLQIATRISDQQNLINCNQSDSTHSFFTKIRFSACYRVTLVPNTVSPGKGGAQS